MGLATYYKSAPPLGKTVIIIAGTLGVVVAYFAVVNPLIKLVKNKLDQAKISKEGKEAGEVLDDLKDKGVNPTLNDAQVEGMVNTLVTAFNGSGTDEDAIYGVFSQLKNDADWYKLVNKFAVRTYDEPLWGETSKTLTAALSDELDLLEKAKINSGLQKMGLTIRIN